MQNHRPIQRSYRLINLIGNGGFAEVWRAVLDGTNEEYAIKLLRDFTNPDARHRFEREVRIIQGLKHPRVIRLVEANVAAEQPFYVMPLMRGGALTAWAGRLPPEGICAILTDLLDFLVYLHAEGGIHRDIKPDNLLVDAAGTFAVGDFGLGNNPRHTVMMTAHAVGTWGYVAPELNLPNATASAAADVYSLGATIFHLLTGIHPKDAHSLDPWSVRSDIPARLRGYVVMMVQSDPKHRPTARQLCELILPKRSQPTPKAAPLGDGWKLLLGLGVLAAIVAIAASD
jgi:serine/threonine protein kinase